MRYVLKCQETSLDPICLISQPGFLLANFRIDDKADHDMIKSARPDRLKGLLASPSSSPE